MSDRTEPEWLDEAVDKFRMFCVTIAQLRDPQNGCPWDLKQDHHTLRRFMLEEAYEACEAMASDDPQHLREELGDVLLQVVLNAQVAADAKTFDISDVIESIRAKMVRRHPHVFDPSVGELSIEEVKANWQTIKQREKSGARKDKPYFREQGCHKVRPATSQADAIGKAAAKIAFDWNSLGAVIDQCQSEWEEVQAELQKTSQSPRNIERELGDLYFSLAQLCRHLGLEPEVVAQGGNDKFLKRFEQVEALAIRSGLDVRTATTNQLEELWQKAKETSPS